MLSMLPVNVLCVLHSYLDYQIDCLSTCCMFEELLLFTVRGIHSDSAVLPTDRGII